MGANKTNTFTKIKASVRHNRIATNKLPKDMAEKTINNKTLLTKKPEPESAILLSCKFCGFGREQ
jgi:hypothetical protein